MIEIGPFHSLWYLFIFFKTKKNCFPSSYTLILIKNKLLIFCDSLSETFPLVKHFAFMKQIKNTYLYNHKWILYTVLPPNLKGAMLDYLCYVYFSILYFFSHLKLVGAAFGAAGQRCMALSTAIFVGSSKEWIPELVERAKNLKVNAGNYTCI